MGLVRGDMAGLDEFLKVLAAEIAALEVRQAESSGHEAVVVATGHPVGLRNACC